MLYNFTFEAIHNAIQTVVLRKLYCRNALHVSSFCQVSETRLIHKTKYSLHVGLIILVLTSYNCNTYYVQLHFPRCSDLLFDHPGQSEP